MPRKPPTFHDFVGHPKLVARLRRQLHGAIERGEPFPPAMFIGASGLGKTLLARALATERGTTLLEAHGNDALMDLAHTLAKADAGDIVFIDEAHALHGKIQELMLCAIDEQRLPGWVEGPATETPPDEHEARQLAPVTLILATDRPRWIRNALRKRMQLVVTLDYYGEREMAEIVDRTAAAIGVLLTPQARNRIAAVAGGLPRTARHHLANLRLHYPDADQRELSLADVRRFLDDFGVDELGLEPAHRHYLSCICEAGTAALPSIATQLGHEAEYVRAEIEAKLIRLGLAIITPSGRRLTEAGRRHLEKISTENRTEEVPNSL